MRALLLTAGLATRFRPHTLKIPKPLLPFWGISQYLYGYELLKGLGVKEFIFNLHFHARPAWTLCIIGVMLSYLFTERQYHRLQARFILLPWVTKLLLFIICLQMVVEVSQESVQPFIYYQF